MVVVVALVVDVVVVAVVTGRGPALGVLVAVAGVVVRLVVVLVAFAAVASCTDHTTSIPVSCATGSLDSQGCPRFEPLPEMLLCASHGKATRSRLRLQVLDHKTANDKRNLMETPERPSSKRSCSRTVAPQAS